MKTGGRLVKHARYYWLLLAEGHLKPAAVWRHATQDLGTAAAERVALPERGSTVFGSKKVSQGAVSVGAPFSPFHQRL